MRRIMLFCAAMFCVAVPSYAQHAHHSVSIVESTGGTCQAAPMHDGWYTAAHCLRDVPPVQWVRVGNTQTSVWSFDPWRDLAHIPGIGLPSQVYRRPALGEVGEIRSPLGTSYVCYMGRVAIENEGIWWYLVRGAGQRRVDLWCLLGGDPSVMGNSGAGIYLTDDALAAIVGASQLRRLDGTYASDRHCGTRQMILAEAVP